MEELNKTCDYCNEESQTSTCPDCKGHETEIMMDDDSDLED